MFFRIGDVKSYFPGETGKGVGMSFRKKFLNVQWLLLKTTELLGLPAEAQ